MFADMISGYDRIHLDLRLLLAVRKSVLRGTHADVLRLSSNDVSPLARTCLLYFTRSPCSLP
jgi:hypothetical protein